MFETSDHRLAFVVKSVEIVYCVLSSFEDRNLRTYVAPLERGGNKKLRALATNHLNNECAKIEKAILKYLKKGVRSENPPNP